MVGEPPTGIVAGGIWKKGRTWCEVWWLCMYSSVLSDANYSLLMFVVLFVLTPPPFLRNDTITMAVFSEKIMAECFRLGSTICTTLLCCSLLSSCAQSCPSVCAAEKGDYASGQGTAATILDAPAPPSNMTRELNFWQTCLFCGGCLESTGHTHARRQSRCAESEMKEELAYMTCFIYLTQLL